MTTRAGAFRDLIFESTNNATVRAWFAGTGWRGWIDAKADGGPAFNPVWTCSRWRLKGGTGIVYLRLLEADYQELRRLNPPMASINILANADPFKKIGLGGDPQSRNVFAKIKSDPALVAIIRDKYPRQKTDESGVSTRGLKFASFGDNFIDVKGDAET